MIVPTGDELDEAMANIASERAQLIELALLGRNDPTIQLTVDTVMSVSGCYATARIQVLMAVMAGVQLGLCVGEARARRAKEDSWRHQT